MVKEKICEGCGQEIIFPIVGQWYRAKFLCDFCHIKRKCEDNPHINYGRLLQTLQKKIAKRKKPRVHKPKRKKEPKFCVVCGLPLLSKQRKFCCQRHSQIFFRQKYGNKYYKHKNQPILYCVVCGKLLVDKQRKFCGNKHYVYHNRKNQREREKMKRERKV